MKDVMLFLAIKVGRNYWKNSHNRTLLMEVEDDRDRKEGKKELGLLSKALLSAPSSLFVLVIPFVISAWNSIRALSLTRK